MGEFDQKSSTLLNCFLFDHLILESCWTSQRKRKKDERETSLCKNDFALNQLLITNCTSVDTNHIFPGVDQRLGVNQHFRIAPKPW